MNAAQSLLLLIRRGSARLTITSFTQSLGAELLISGDFSSQAGWTTEAGWVIGGGVLTGTPVQTGVTYQGITLSVNDWYEVAYSVATSTAGSVYATLGATAADKGLTINSVVDTQEILRWSGGLSLLLFISDPALGFGGTIDDASVKLVTQNAVATMPNADGTHTFSFTLPGSTKAGQRVEMRYRYQDITNYWAARLIRNAANTAWDFALTSVSAGTETSRISVTDVGTPDALRVVTSGTTHTPYTGVAGVFTQRSAVSVSHLDTETGITTIYSSAITPVSVTSF